MTSGDSFEPLVLPGTVFRFIGANPAAKFGHSDDEIFAETLVQTKAIAADFLW